MSDYPNNIPLGKATAYISQYDPALLCPFPRQVKRDEIGVEGSLPFSGGDLWNGYELSWLNLKGMPQVAMARFFFACESPFLIESKSFKLYLNSFNQTSIDSWDKVQRTLTTDLSAVSGAPVRVELLRLSTAGSQLDSLPGDCLDDLDLHIDNYQLQPAGLKADADNQVSEILHSHLLKSNCLVTNQPDWGSILIEYSGARIDREALLRYLISFRQHNEFHEQCVERIFVDLQRTCRPRELSVQAWYTRRGGLDINPFRTNCCHEPRILRLVRQ
ncbi:NADPH-dependent 7-cyano-7-deazaguanine reductase QueF [Geopsychrobacter electrodiphilus]|uniref:NADPH-dependent 7-cyano-7-deazaguanine reductase QueF n=1 Tax=Geopsychrobacter electrodiphilus TaxID=225196 RepID=UPI0003789127|nr:NADPH-dependent 7-cyano-7-deazaguanine reductase QueF [Geopsychrobacter electrodiphilus]